MRCARFLLTTPWERRKVALRLAEPVPGEDYRELQKALFSLLVDRDIDVDWTLPSVPMMMRHRPAGSLPLRAEVTASDGYEHFE